MIIDPVTYEDVRKACCDLLGDGEGPSRPKVQDVLVTQIGRKGSNSVVQGFINRFWAEAAERMNKPTRQVADIPEQFVPIVDRALMEMVAISRKMAAEEFTEREEQLAGQIKEWQAAMQRANEIAATAEQLRLRAEGELNGLQSIVSDLRGSVGPSKTGWQKKRERLRVDSRQSRPRTLNLRASLLPWRHRPASSSKPMRIIAWR